MKNKYGSECYRIQDNGKYGFDKVELPFYGEVSTANMSLFKVGMFKTIKGLFIGIEGKGAYVFKRIVHPEYASEKLQLTGSDAPAIADFINGQFGIHEQFYTPQTEYL